jgi:hypothetical protein
MGNIFVAISSCWRFELNGWNSVVRDTWLKDTSALGIPYKFFHGRGEDSRLDSNDIVTLNCYDDYPSLMYKTLDKFKWVLEKGYDSVFHCYHDTYACAERLLMPKEVDYFGDYYHQDSRQPWPHFSHGNSCQSGQGVFISRRALEKVVEEFPKLMKENPKVWEEDWWTGLSINKHPELVIRDTRDMPCNLTQHDHGPRRSNNTISCHLSTIQPDGHWDGQGRETEWKYRPEFMHKLHREWQESCKQ